MKRSQAIMIWFLPLIVIGGFFYPAIGYIVVAMMAFFITLSFFKGRWWCWHLCPRGAFLDIVMSKVSPGKNIPRLFMKMWFRWLVFAILMTFVAWRILASGGNLPAIGLVFVTMCGITTIFAVIIAVFARHRGWCMICPMGTLQEAIHGKSRKGRAK